VTAVAQYGASGSSAPGFSVFMARIAPSVTYSVIALSLVALVLNNFFHDRVAGPNGVSVSTGNVFIAVVALGVGVFVWAAAWGHPLVLGGVFIGWWAGLGLWLSYSGRGLAGVTWAICATAVTSFVAVLMTQGATQAKTITKNSMRNAIAGSFVLTYLVTVGLVVFLRAGEAGEELSPIAEQFIPNFTWLMGTVIGFYFGTTAIEKLAEIRSLGTSTPEAQPRIVAAAEE